MALRAGESYSGGFVRDTDGRVTLGREQSSTANNGAGTVAVGTTSTQIVASNPDRFEVTIVNDSANVIYLGLGTAAVAGRGVRLNANGGSYTTTTYTGAVNGIFSGTGTSNVTFVEV